MYKLCPTKRKPRYKFKHNSGITTPLDVAKTRIMLSEKLHGDKLKVGAVLSDIWISNGLRGLYAGFLPRVTWMALGGFIFFGAYEKTKEFWTYRSDSKAVIYKAPTLETLFSKGYDYWFMDEVRRKGFKTFDDVIDETKMVAARRAAAVAAQKVKKEEEEEEEEKKKSLS